MTAVTLLSGMLACDRNRPVVFDGAFVHVSDERGFTSSEVSWESNANLVTYYVNLVCPGDFGEVTVDYELVVGNGLEEGVDFKHIASTAGPLSFPSGVYRRPVRIEWLRHEIDPSRDNSVRIRLTGCDHPKVMLGKPGPDRLGREYMITKK